MSQEAFDKGTTQWELDLAVALGYDVSATTRCILPVHPFTIIGDEVIVREVVVDGEFRAVHEGGFPFREVRHTVPAGFDRSVLGVSA